MVANEGLEKAEPMNPGPPGPMALHPFRRMRCELFQVKRPQEHTYSFFRVELSQLLGEIKSPMRMEMPVTVEHVQYTSTVSKVINSFQGVQHSN